MSGSQRRVSLPTNCLLPSFTQRAKNSEGGEFVQWWTATYGYFRQVTTLLSFSSFPTEKRRYPACTFEETSNFNRTKQEEIDYETKPMV
jgi:hypothetical protein